MEKMSSPHAARPLLWCLWAAGLLFGCRPADPGGPAPAADLGAADAGSRDGGDGGAAARAPLCTHPRFCWEDPWPQGNDLRAVFSTGEGETWAVGSLGTILRRDG